MADNFLGATALLETPEAQAGVVAGGDEFGAGGGEREGGYGRGVRKHVVGALACGVDIFC